MLTVGTGRVTETVTDWVADPPAPVQVSAYSVSCLSAPVDHEPLVDTAPLQPPLAVQAVASLVAHVNLDSPRCTTVVGEAVRVTVGACAASTCADRGATWEVPEVALPELFSSTLGVRLALGFNCAVAAGVASAVPAAALPTGIEEPDEQAASTHIDSPGRAQRVKRGASLAINPA